MEGGFDGTSLATVARRAGISKAAVLHHFPSKEALYVAALGRVVDDLAAFIAGARAADTAPEARLDHLARLDRLGLEITRYLGAHPDGTRLLVMELLAGGPFARGPGRAFIRATMELTAAFLRDGMTAGAFAQADPRQLAVSIASMHLTYFGMARSLADFLGGDPLSPRMLAARGRAVVAEVRALCRGGAAPPRPARAHR